MKRTFAIFLLFFMFAMGQMSTPVHAASSMDDFDGTLPVIGGLVGGFGTVWMLSSMSKTMHSATDANHNIKLENSRITYRNDKYLYTNRRKKDDK